MATAVPPLPAAGVITVIPPSPSPRSGTVLPDAIGPRSLLHLPRTHARPASHWVDLRQLEPAFAVSVLQPVSANESNSTLPASTTSPGACPDKPVLPARIRSG